MARALGVDLGSRRIGFAISDADRMMAVPLTVIERESTRSDDHDAILAIARDHEADTIVVGLPLTLEGEIGTAARRVLSEVDQLRRRAGGEAVVEAYDERLTTVTADGALLEAGMRRRERRERRDAVAAAHILQSWLDVNASGDGR